MENFMEFMKSTDPRVAAYWKDQESLANTPTFEPERALATTPTTAPDIPPPTQP